MATQDGKRKRKRRNPPLRYFYLNGDLHRTLHISRGEDILTAWNYPQHKRAGYSYTDVRRRAEKAYTTKEVCQLLNRGRDSIAHAIMRGDITPPQITYGLSEHKKRHKYMWSEKDILEAHAYFRQQHKGPPRKDGLITVQSMPTETELRAMMRQEVVMYQKQEDGTFVPTWRAEQF